MQIFTPALAAAALYHALIWLVRQAAHRHVAWLEGLLLLVCYVPLGLAADAVIAKGFFDWRTDGATSIGTGAAVLTRPGLAALLAKLVVRITFWMMVAVVPAVLVLTCEIAPRMFLFGLRHPGVKMPPGPHVQALVAAFVWFIAHAVFISRYSFVLPCFAIARPGPADYLETGIWLVKPMLRTVMLLNIVEYSLSFLAGYMLEHGWHAAGSIALARNAMAAAATCVIGTYFELAKTELTVKQIEAGVLPSR